MKSKQTSELETKTYASILAAYPGIAGKSKKQRVEDYINGLSDLGNGFKRINESAFNSFRFVSPNEKWGGLEDISTEYIMRVANTMGYRCLRSNFDGIVLRPKKD